MTGQVARDIHAAFVKCARGWILSNYTGGRKMLEDWKRDEAHYVRLLGLRSYSLEDSRAANLRRFRRLVRDGVLIEQPSGISGRASCYFSLPTDAQSAEIYEQATAELIALGYRAGVMMRDMVPC